MRVPFGRQVEHRIARIQIRSAAGTVGQTGHLDLAEDCGQVSLLSGLHTGVGHLFGVAYRVQPLLPNRTQVQVVLHQLTQQRPPVTVQARLQFAVLEPTGALIVEQGAQRLEPLPGPGERVRIHHGINVHRRDRSRRAASAASPSRARASSSALAWE